MRCPKCGSEYVLENYCQECGLKDLKTYQQRLDKVLSKFEDKSKKWLYYEYKLGYGVYMMWVDNKFLLLANNYEYKISLDTVESLLKDLEVQDE